MPRAGLGRVRKKSKLTGLAPLFDPVDASHHRTGKHLHDRAASFGRRFRLHGDVTTGAANRVVNAEASSHHTAADQEQRGECECELSHCRSNGDLPSKVAEKGIGVVPTQARATAFQLRWDERLLMKVTSERIRNIIPAAIARLVIHVQTSSASFSTSSRSSGVMSTGLMFFSTSFGLTFFSLLGLLPVHSQNTPIVDLKCPLSTFPRFSLVNSQQVLPLPQITLEAQALGDLTRRDDTFPRWISVVSLFEERSLLGHARQRRATPAR
jgi:hypothetical protein